MRVMKDIYAKESPGGFGKQDIYRIEIFSNDHPRKFFVRGMVKVADLISNINDSVKISAMNIKNPKSDNNCLFKSKNR